MDDYDYRDSFSESYDAPLWCGDEYEPIGPGAWLTMPAPEPDNM